MDLGSYFLSADHDVGVADGETIEVVANGASNLTIQLKWPNRNPLLVRSMKGVLRGPDYDPQQTQAHITLSLLEPVSRRVVDVAQSESSGRFSFNDAVQPGLYFLKLNESDDVIPIQVRPDAKADTIALDFGSNGCGLQHAQRPKLPTISTNLLRGEADDPAYAVIPDAEVWLLTDSEDFQVLEKTQTDGAGQFALRENRNGTYRLFVKKRGLGPFFQEVHLEVSEQSDECQRSMRVALDVI